MKAFIIGLAAVVIIGVGAYVVLHKPASTTPSPAPSQVQARDDSSHNSPNTITFDGDHFSPATLTVSAGTTVTVKNSSSQELQFDSDPHPVHTDDTDLNAGTIDPGHSQTFTVEKTGTFGYHDHLNPSIQGTIIIK